MRVARALRCSAQHRTAPAMQQVVPGEALRGIGVGRPPLLRNLERKVGTRDLPEEPQGVDDLRQIRRARRIVDVVAGDVLESEQVPAVLLDMPP